MRHRNNDDRRSKDAPQTEHKGEPESHYQTLMANLISLKTKISAWEIDKFESSGLHNVDDILELSSAVAPKMAREVISKDIKAVIHEYKEIEKSLNNWGKPSGTNSFEILNSRILKLENSIAKPSNEAMRHYKYLVNNLYETLEEAISESEERLVELQMEAENIDIRFLELEVENPNNHDKPELVKITDNIYQSIDKKHLKRSNEDLISFYRNHIIELEKYKDKITTSYASQGEARLDPKGDNLEQMIGHLDGVTLELHKCKTLDSEKVDAENRIPTEARNAVLADFKNTTFKKISMQNIRNNNFVTDMPKQTQHTLHDSWKEIINKRLEIINSINLNKNEKSNSEGPKNLEAEVIELGVKYQAYKDNFIAAETKRRENSKITILFSEMISTIENAINSKQLEGPSSTDWTKWVTEAKKLKEKYIDLTFDKPFHKSIPEITGEHAEIIADKYKPAVVEYEFVEQILKINLDKKQVNELSAKHDTTTFKGKFYHTMHELFSKLKKWAHKKDEFSSTHFANPAGVKMMQLSKTLKKSHREITHFFAEPRMAEPKQKSWSHKVEKGGRHHH